MQKGKCSIVAINGKQLGAGLGGVGRTGINAFILVLSLQLKIKELQAVSVTPDNNNSMY